MSGRGRHRRKPTRRISRRITRASFALTAGGAGIALPLVASGNAQAASTDVWDKVAQCESIGNWSINSGNGFYGGLQFTQSTWQGFGGTEYAQRADLATRDQQIDIAEKVLAEQGPNAWPVCGPKAGLTQNGGSPDISPDSQQSSGAKPEQSKSSGQAENQAPQGGGSGSYTVDSGDTLGRIADAQHVDGGWKRLYQDNRKAIGGDPDLIYPGQKLTLSGSGGSGQAPQGSDRNSGGSASTQQSSSSNGDYQAPVDAGTSTPYGAAGGSWSSGHHTGVDFSAASGTPVEAVTDGTVVSAGWGGSYGNQVVIKNDDGRYTQYGHLTSASVQAGQTVDSGDRLGLSGATGNATGPHLHFEVRTSPDYGSDIDPVAYLRQHGVTV